MQWLNADSGIFSGPGQMLKVCAPVTFFSIVQYVAEFSQNHDF